MKLIATVPLLNNFGIKHAKGTDGKAVDPLWEHDGQISRGQVFEVGTAPDYDGLTPDEKKVVMQLVGARADGKNPRVLFADAPANKAKIARLLAEVAQEQKDKATQAAKAKAAEETTTAAVLEKLPALVAAAVAALKK